VAQVLRSLPTYDRILFDSSNLELCLVQTTFPPVPRFGEEEFLIPIKEALSEEYPLFETEQAMNLLITPKGVDQTPAGARLRFASIDHRWEVVLSNESVSLETREYSEIVDFCVRYSTVLGHVARHFRPQHQLRFGLRYVNEFRDPKGDEYDRWRTLLNPDLLGGPSEVLDGAVEQTISEVRLSRPDGRLLVRHGFLSGTTVFPGRNRDPKMGSFYLLDLDYYDEASTRFESNPTPRMQAYNDILYRIFRWAIGEGELYSRLKRPE
jgi:uncharacterized protein (TIGR04255 family)